MKRQAMMLSVAAMMILFVPSAHSQNGNGTFNLNAASIGGATGAVSMTGGGTYDVARGFASGGGTFRCLADINSGPLSGLKAGEGVRWHVARVLQSTGFKCGAPGETAKTAVTDNDTVALSVEFFRQGDGATPSFTANMFISDEDEAQDLPGIQNVWIQAVGCGEASTHVH